MYLTVKPLSDYVPLDYLLYFSYCKTPVILKALNEYLALLHEILIRKMSSTGLMRS